MSTVARPFTHVDIMRSKHFEENVSKQGQSGAFVAFAHNDEANPDDMLNSGRAFLETEECETSVNLPFCLEYSWESIARYDLKEDFSFSAMQSRLERRFDRPLSVQEHEEFMAALVTCTLDIFPSARLSQPIYDFVFSFSQKETAAISEVVCRLDITKQRWSIQNKIINIWFDRYFQYLGYHR